MPERVTPTGLFFSAFWMGGHHHATGHALRPDRHSRAVVEAAHDLTFRALLALVWGEVQTRLNEWMIEHRVLFAAGHKGETRQIGEDGPGAILSIEPQQDTLLWNLVRCEVAPDRREALAQFLPVASVAAVAKTAELCGIKTEMSRVIHFRCRAIASKN